MKPSTLRTSCTSHLSKEMITLMPVRMVNAKRTLKDEELPPQPVLSLKTLELSNIDLVFDDYTSVALFYDVHGQRAGSIDIVGILLAALEELLVHFPAAAGRLRINETEGRLEVVYNSAPSPNINFGVQFVAAHADIAFSELGDVSAPHSSLDLLHPTLLKDSQGGSGNHRPYPIMAIQVTTFTCGGFTLALMSNHALMDGHGVAVFLQNLCSIARGEGLVSPPETLSRRELMKPRTSSPSLMVGRRFIASAPVELQFGNATRFVFSAASLEALRLKASGQAIKKCSRFTALAALLWTAQAKSVAAMGSRRPDEEFPIRLPVNLRERVVPALTRGYTGNATLQCMVSATVQELCQSPLEFVVDKIKAAMASITAEDAQSEIDYIELQLRGSAGELPHLDHSCLAMPSLFHLPFYDTDCGWGRPVYCGRPSKEPFQRLFVLDHPAAGAWNVLNAFHSDEERASFQAAIAEYITTRA